MIARSSLLLLALALCVYAYSSSLSGDAWQSKSASEKIDFIMNKAGKDKNPNRWPKATEFVQMFIESMDPTFDFYGDDMPSQGLKQERLKLIHSVGPIQRATWTSVGNHNFTGVFKSGSQNAIIRFSSATKPDVKVPKMTPGISMKFLREGMYSANILAMYSLEGQDNFNFFKHDLSNHPPDLNQETASLPLRLLKKTFLKASDYPTVLGLSGVAKYDSAGNEACRPNFPFKLIFHPTSAVHTLFPDTPANDNPDNYCEQIKTIPAGTHIYDVYAEAFPGDKAPKKIAEVSTKSSSDTSMFGDKDLFFQHTSMETDLAYMPEWQSPLEAILKEQSSIPRYVYPDLPFN